MRSRDWILKKEGERGQTLFYLLDMFAMIELNLEWNYNFTHKFSPRMEVQLNAKVDRGDKSKSSPWKRIEQSEL